MTLQTNLILIGVCAGLALFCGWRGARPWDPRRGPRLAPWGFMMLLAVTAAIVLAGEAAARLGLMPPGPR